MCPASSCVLYSRPADGWEAVRPWNSCTQPRTLASQGNRAIVHQLPGNTQLKLAVNFSVLNFSSNDASVVLSALYTGVFIHLWGFLVTDLTVKASGYPENDARNPSLLPVLEKRGLEQMEAGLFSRHPHEKLTFISLSLRSWPSWRSRGDPNWGLLINVFFFLFLVSWMKLFKDYRCFYLLLTVV